MQQYFSKHDGNGEPITSSKYYGKRFNELMPGPDTDAGIQQRGILFMVHGSNDPGYPGIQHGQLQCNGHEREPVFSHIGSHISYCKYPACSKYHDHGIEHALRERHG